MKTIIEKDPLMLHKKVIGALKDFCMNEGDVPLLLLVSGGSVLEVFRTNTLPLGQSLTLGVLDERFSDDALHNNFLQLQETALYRDAVDAGAQSIDTSPGVATSVGGLALRMDTALRDWRAKNPQGKVAVIMGIGGDGHTAGIMPMQEDVAKFTTLFDTAEVWVAGYDAKEKNAIPLRATVTLSFLREQVDSAFVYVVGDAKADVLHTVLDNRGDLPACPARIIHEMKAVTLLTDILL